MTAEFSLWTRSHRETAASFYELVRNAAETNPTAVFLPSISAEGKEITFERAFRFVEGLESFLSQRGADPGDRVVIARQNSTLTALLLIGVIASGRVAVPLSPKSGAGEIAHIIEQTQPKLVLTEPGLAESLGFGSDIAFLIADELQFFEMVRQTDPGPSPHLDGRSDAEIVYLPDASGRPKGVVLTHENLLAESFAFGERFNLTANDALLTVVGLSHPSGQVFTLFAPLWCGARTAVVRPEIAMLRFWKVVDEHRPSWSLVVPAYLEMLVAAPSGANSPTLEGLVVGGARLTSDLISRFEAKHGIRVHQSYGLTETSSTVAVDTAPIGQRSTGGVGTAMPCCDVAVFDQNGERAAVGTLGEVRIAGANVFDRYYMLPDATATKLIGGWVHTGDVGEIDELGNLHIRGRLDDLIITGGENVYPAEIEQHIDSLGGVEEAYLASAPHTVLGAEPVLVYRLANGATPDESAWRMSLASQLSVFKIPKYFIEITRLGVNEFPRSPIGLVDRRRLTELVETVSSNGGRWNRYVD